MSKNVRALILETAEKCVNGQREQDYGTPEDNFASIASLWTTYLQTKNKNITNAKITSLDVAMMMSLLKVARVASGTGSRDCFVDLAGYAACAGEIANYNVNEYEEENK